MIVSPNFVERAPAGGYPAFAKKQLAQMWASGLIARATTLSLAIPIGYNLLASGALRQLLIPWMSCLMPTAVTWLILLLGVIPQQRRVWLTPKGLRVEKLFLAWPRVSAWWPDAVSGELDVIVVASDGAQTRVQVPREEADTFTSSLKQHAGEPLAVRPEAPPFLVGPKWLLSIATWAATVGLGAGYVASSLTHQRPLLGKLLYGATAVLGGGLPALLASWTSATVHPVQRRAWAVGALMYGGSLAMLMAMLGAAYAVSTHTHR